MYKYYACAAIAVIFLFLLHFIASKMNTHFLTVFF